MQVKVVSLVNAFGKSPQGLKKEAVYRVIAVEMSLYHRTVEYTIVNEYGTVASYHQSHFEIIDNKVEADWIVKKVGDKYYQLTPECIAYDGFAEEFYDGKKKAQEVFYTRFPEFREVTEEDVRRERTMKTEELLKSGKGIYEVSREVGLDIDEVGDIYAQLVEKKKLIP